MYRSYLDVPFPLKPLDSCSKLKILRLIRGIEDITSLKQHMFVTMTNIK